MSDAVVPTRVPPLTRASDDRDDPVGDVRVAALPVAGPWPVTGEHSPVWPPAVRHELAERRRAIEAQLPAGANVLDLADARARARLAKAGAPGTDRRLHERYDAIVSVAALPTFADLPLAVRGMAALLAPDGWLHVVEPVGRPGWSGVLDASLGSLLPSARGLHLGRDIPLAVRTEGLLITDLARFTMPTWMWPLRSFVAGRARPDFEVPS